MKRADIERIFDQQQELCVEQWKELLAISSISTEPEHEEDCIACADWLTNHLEGIGFDARKLETSGKPLVFAQRDGDPDLPTVLLYGHYDVQPVDPIDEWDTAPFDPVIKSGRMYARGAEDNKGQLMYVLKAVEALIERDELRPTIKIIIEGEEECGSESTSAALADLNDLLKADILMVSDTSAVSSGAPTVIMGLRGMLHLTVELTGASKDLHSGVHGGRAPNPAQGIAELVAGLHRANGTVAVGGFYDGVKPPSDSEKAMSEAGSVSDDEYAEQIGVSASVGETEFVNAVRAGFRPTLEVNGIHSGYGGAGTKTVIPSSAFVKLSARLVPGQEPDKTMFRIIRHLEGCVPVGMTLKVTDHGVAGGALSLSPDSKLAGQAVEVLSEISDQEPVLQWEGASIPILVELAEASGAQPLLVGFGAEEDNIHAPNESFSLERFRRGFTYVAAMLSRLGE